MFQGKRLRRYDRILQILVKKGRFSERNAIFAYFTAKVKEYKKIGVALVTSPFELTAEQKTKIEKRLLDTTDYKRWRSHTARIRR